MLFNYQKSVKFESNPRDAVSAQLEYLREFVDKIKVRFDNSQGQEYHGESIKANIQVRPVIVAKIINPSAILNAKPETHLATPGTGVRPKLSLVIATSGDSNDTIMVVRDPRITPADVDRVKGLFVERTNELVVSEIPKVGLQSPIRTPFEMRMFYQFTNIAHLKYTVINTLVYDCFRGIFFNGTNNKKPLDEDSGRGTSLWGLKFAEWLGSTTGGVAGRERFGAGYRRFAAFIEWGVSAKAAFWGVMGTMAFAGSPVGWAVAPALGMVYGILFFGSHFIPKSMAPVTKVKVGVVQALTMGVIYGVLIGATPFLLGAVPLFGVPEFGVKMAGVLWGLTGVLHSSFDREKPREAGERAAWNLVGQLASIHGVFETVMPGIQSDHTDQIVGKGGLSADSLSTILARFKNDVEFREGFVGAIQKAMEKGGLSSAQMNLLSLLVKGATGQPIAFLHVLGKTPLVELAKLETLSGQVNSPEKGGFTMALVVPLGQTEGVNFRVASLKAKGVQIFE